MFFKTKRQRRGAALSRWTHEKWLNHELRKWLLDTRDDGMADASMRVIDETNRPIEQWLDVADKHPEFAALLDRALGLRNDAEDEEYHAWWTATGSKASLIISACALLISLLVALFK